MEIFAGDLAEWLWRKFQVSVGFNLTCSKERGFESLSRQFIFNFWFGKFGDLLGGGGGMVKSLHKGRCAKCEKHGSGVLIYG